MNLPTLISYAEFCFLGSNKRSHRVAASATRGWQDDSWPGAGFLYNSVLLDSVGWHGDSPPEAGFSQSRRAPPEAHKSKPNYHVSRCRFRLAFCSTTDANIQGLVYSTEGPARAPAGSRYEELAQGDVLALADEPTCKLPASGWDF